MRNVGLNSDYVGANINSAAHYLCVVGYSGEEANVFIHRSL